MLKEIINSFIMALSNKESAIFCFLHNERCITHPNKGGVKNEEQSEKESK